jgi:hypothetical protein
MHPKETGCLKFGQEKGNIIDLIAFVPKALQLVKSCF